MRLPSLDKRRSSFPADRHGWRECEKRRNSFFRRLFTMQPLAHTVGRAFQDHFSAQADAYARFRPTCPDAPYAWLASRVPTRALAWDCGTGNGQAAVALAAHFTQVIASDPSREQLAHAAAHARVRYLAARAEQPPAGAIGADLVTAAQALHWFDLERFYPVLERVLRPGGLFAAWGYGLVRITPQVVWPLFLRLGRCA